MVIVENLDYKKKSTDKKKKIPGSPPELSIVNIRGMSVDSLLQARRQAHATIRCPSTAGHQAHSLMHTFFILFFREGEREGERER